MKDNSKLVAIILSILAVLVVVLSFIFNNKQTTSDIKIVENYSEFYTVNSCLYRTITYISSKDIDSLILVLNDRYREKNKIDSNNILDLFPNIESNSTFVSKKMYYEKINHDIIKYYVYGYIQLEQLFEDGQIANSDRQPIYFIVYLDSNKKVFSIEPYSGEIFIGGDTNE